MFNEIIIMNPLYNKLEIRRSEHLFTWKSLHTSQHGSPVSRKTFYLVIFTQTSQDQVISDIFTYMENFEN